MQGRSPILALLCGTSWNSDSRERNYIALKPTLQAEQAYDQPAEQASTQQQSQTCVVCQVA